MKKINKTWVLSLLMLMASDVYANPIAPGAVDYEYKYESSYFLAFFGCWIVVLAICITLITFLHRKNKEAKTNEEEEKR